MLLWIVSTAWFLRDSATTSVMTYPDSLSLRRSVLGLG